jgi:hypothetical protein
LSVMIWLLGDFFCFAVLAEAGEALVVEPILTFFARAAKA